MYVSCSYLLNLNVTSQLLVLMEHTSTHMNSLPTCSYSQFYFLILYIFKIEIQLSYS